jgi:hypothetical protein
MPQSIISKRFIVLARRDPILFVIFRNSGVFSGGSPLTAVRWHLDVDF